MRACFDSRDPGGISRNHTKVQVLILFNISINVMLEIWIPEKPDIRGRSVLENLIKGGE